MSVPSCRSVMVTGATGCVGSALVDQCIAAGYRANVLIRNSSSATQFPNPNVRVFVGDLLDGDVLRQATTNVETVFHLAAAVPSTTRIGVDEEGIFRVNVEGTRKILEASVANNVSNFVFFSTVAVMARQSGSLDETAPCLPTTPYAQSKLEAEHLVFKHQREDGLRVCVLRLPLVYGPRDRGNMVRLIEAIARKRYLIIGSGKNVKTMVYSENAAAAALHVLKFARTNGQIYIVSDPGILNLTELSQAIAEELGVSLHSPHIPKILGLGLGILCDGIKSLGGPTLPLSVDRVQKLTSDFYCTSAKITTELGFKPPFSFREGLTRTVNWHERSTTRFSC